jgi:hypothetical protein
VIHHSQRLAFPFAFLFAACSAIALTPAQREQLAAAANQSQKTGICNIHHIRMQQKLVPIEFGHLPVELLYSSFHDARLREFPNAREYVLRIGLGSQHTTEKVPRYVCPLCKRAQREWLLKHPNDEYGKSLAQLGSNQSLQLTAGRRDEELYFYENSQ